MRLIGVSPALTDQPGRLVISRNYMLAIARAGALPVMLPLYGGAAPLWEEMLARIDGLVLSGGGDIDPALFGEEMLPVSNPPAPLRDEQELYLCCRAYAMDMPVLGVCRGAQVMNVAAGGALYQDIPSQYPGGENHRFPHTQGEKVHRVDIVPGTLLEKIAGQAVIGVNSLHHQSIKTPGQGMIINARARDGIIEGAEMPEKTFALGLQWHPEILSARHPEAQAIFDAFIAACEKKAENQTEERKNTMHLIGVTPAQDDKSGRIIINQDYLDAVYRAGALPVLLPLYGDQPALWDAMIDAIDGLLLSGGADVGPLCYGEDTLPLCGETSPLRDSQEFYLCKKALEKDLPILAICRGHQVLNCALGGTLYQDIAAQYGEELKHPRYEVPADQVHEVTVEKDSRLYQITGLSTLKVNSRHHQAVKDVGEGLKITARATDGLIEGIELPGKKFVVGVQWHPESLSSYAPDAQALFNAFVSACGGKQ